MDFVKMIPVKWFLLNAPEKCVGNRKIYNDGVSNSRGSQVVSQSGRAVRRIDTSSIWVPAVNGGEVASGLRKCHVSASH